MHLVLGYGAAVGPGAAAPLEVHLAECRGVRGGQRRHGLRSGGREGVADGLVGQGRGVVAGYVLDGIQCRHGVADRQRVAGAEGRAECEHDARGAAGRCCGNGPGGPADLDGECRRPRDGIRIQGLVVGQLHLRVGRGGRHRQRGRGLVDDGAGRQDGVAVADRVGDRVGGERNGHVGVRGCERRGEGDLDLGAADRVRGGGQGRRARLEGDLSAVDGADGLAEGEGDLRLVGGGLGPGERRPHPVDLVVGVDGEAWVRTGRQLAERPVEPLYEISYAACLDAYPVGVVFAYHDGPCAFDRLRVRADHAIRFRAVHVRVVVREVRCKGDIGVYGVVGIAPPESQVFVEGQRDLDRIADGVGLVGARVRGDGDRCDRRRRVGRRGLLGRGVARANVVDGLDLGGVPGTVVKAAYLEGSAAVGDRSGDRCPAGVCAAGGLLVAVLDAGQVRRSVVGDRDVENQGLVLRRYGKLRGSGIAVVLASDGHLE